MNEIITKEQVEQYLSKKGFIDRGSRWENDQHGISAWVYNSGRGCAFLAMAEKWNWRGGRSTEVRSLKSIDARIKRLVKRIEENQQAEERRKELKQKKIEEAKEVFAKWLKRNPERRGISAVFSADFNAGKIRFSYKGKGFMAYVKDDSVMIKSVDFGELPLEKYLSVIDFVWG